MAVEVVVEVVVESDEVELDVLVSGSGKGQSGNGPMDPSGFGSGFGNGFGAGNGSGNMLAWRGSRIGTVHSVIHPFNHGWNPVLIEHHQYENPHHHDVDHVHPLLPFGLACANAFMSSFCWSVAFA